MSCCEGFQGFGTLSLWEGAVEFAQDEGVVEEWC